MAVKTIEVKTVYINAIKQFNIVLHSITGLMLKGQLEFEDYALQNIYRNDNNNKQYLNT